MNVNYLYENRRNFYLTPSGSARGSTYLCLALGAIGVGLGFYRGEGARVWGSYLFNLFYFFSLALGGMAFAAMQDVIGAVWARPIRRLHEAFGAFIPVSIVFFLIFLAAVALGVGGAGDVYSWIKDPGKVAHYFGKGFWLRKNFMIGRDLVALGLVCTLVMWQLKQFLRRDMAFVEGNRDEAVRLGEEARAKTRYWSAPILIVYAFGFSLLGFDLLMSLDPLWMSTLWGGWLFAIMMQTLMALLLLVMFSLKPSAIGSLIGRQQFHDVGKMMHGFTIFFAYLTFAHVLTYWYGNMPEETEYFIRRLSGPWLWIVLGAPILSFAIPLYVMIFKAAKWTAAVAVPIAVIILAAQWLAYLLVVMPEIVPVGAAATTKWNGPWLEFMVFLGFLGLFLQTYFWFGRRFPMVGLADPLLPAALHGDHH